MRTAFIETITELARHDDRVWLVTGDLGFSVFEGFMEEFPDRYLNVGVAEQNMVGVAAGLALSGFRPFVYSISTFASMRAYEQVRNDVCYQNLPVVIVGGGSTFSYSTFGSTHMPLEDGAIMRALPNMRVCIPGDPHEVHMLLNTLHNVPGPAYMRIAKKGEPVVHKKDDIVTMGKMSEVRAGKDVTVVVSGRQLPNVLTAAEILCGKGIEVRVLSAHTLKPFDGESIVRAINETGRIVTVEEHSLVGGLASAVAETAVGAGLSPKFASLGVPDIFPKGVGSQEYFLDQYQITTEGIVETVQSLWKENE